MQCMKCMEWKVMTMLFNEIYGIYFQTVQAILTEAVNHEVTREEIIEIVKRFAFDESSLSIPDALGKAHWQLLKDDGAAIIKNEPLMPISNLQKSWINAIANDPRMRLFTDNPIIFEDVEPLFLPEDYYVFDSYSDGDSFEDEGYIARFRLILDAIRNHYPINISLVNRAGKVLTTETLPEYLEYSEKDDKFRLIGRGSELGSTINLARIVSCSKCEDAEPKKLTKRNMVRPRSVIFELIDDRNALERVMMHFAHYEKQAEKIGDRKYRITLNYNKDDETEIVIRILSFGPMIKVVAPTNFIDLIIDRLHRQMRCGL